MHNIMVINENRHRFLNNYKWEELKTQPYDYVNNGLVRHLLSNKMINSKNPILKYILSVYEASIIYMLKTVDILKNFHNYNWKN